MATLKRNGGDNSRQESTAGTTKVHVKMLEGAGVEAEVVGDKEKFLARWTSGCPVEDVHFCLANVEILFKLQLY